MEYKEVMKDSYLFKQGDPFTHFYFILFGDFAQYVHNDKKEFKLASLSRFYCFGLEESYTKSEECLSSV